jgi:hypothetical protein
MLDRIKIIQRLIRVTGAENYLEIGVNNGRCFLRVKAARKMAVDPSFKIPPGRKFKYLLKNISNFNNQYFEQTSDDFFSSHAALLKQHKPQVVFVDGLHTYEQALRDVLNSLAFLDEGGVVLMHDCNPLTATAAYPANSIDHAKASLPDYKGVWNGDVWKAVVHLRALHSDLEVFVLDCDHGIGVAKKGSARNSLNLSWEEIQKLTYKDLEANRNTLLNLKAPEFFEQFLQEHLVGKGIAA